MMGFWSEHVSHTSGVSPGWAAVGGLFVLAWLVVVALRG